MITILPPEIQDKFGNDFCQSQLLTQRKTLQHLDPLGNTSFNLSPLDAMDTGTEDDDVEMTDEIPINY